MDDSSRRFPAHLFVAAHHAREGRGLTKGVLRIPRFGGEKPVPLTVLAAGRTRIGKISFCDSRFEYLGVTYVTLVGYFEFSVPF